MNANFVMQALDARWTGKDRFAAACPVHGGKSRNALKGRVLDDKIVLICFSGCKTEDILEATRLAWTDLFEDNTRFTTPERKQILWKRQVAEGFTRWRDAELRRCAEELRARDTFRGAITTMVQAGNLSEENVWPALESAYDEYSHLEYKFDVLRTGTDRDALEVYRNE